MPRGTWWDRIRRVVIGRAAEPGDPPSDAELLRRYARTGDEAAFLVLSRKAGSVRGANVAGWLFRVARRVAGRAHRQALTRANRETPLTAEPAARATDPVERVVVVMKDDAAREAPLAAVLFDQLARVAAGRKATMVAVL